MQPTTTAPRHNDDEDALLAAVDEGLADEEAGRTVPYEKVRRWLLSWGSKKELPPPKRAHSMGQ
jgi:predicted transcriptional regulator